MHKYFNPQESKNKIYQYFINNKNKQFTFNDIITIAHDELKIPKKILKRMAKTQFKQSFQVEVAESKEFEALFESMQEVK